MSTWGSRKSGSLCSRPKSPFGWGETVKNNPEQAGNLNAMFGGQRTWAHLGRLKTKRSGSISRAAARLLSFKPQRSRTIGKINEDRGPKV